MTKKQQNSVKQLSFNLKKYIKKNDTKQNTPTRNLSAMQQTQEMWVWSLGREDPLDGDMATHSSILAFKVRWTEKPGRLQFVGLQRVGHNWVTKHTPRVRASLVAQQWKIDLSYRRCGFDPWVRKIPWRRNWHPTQYSCLGNPMDRRAWRTTIHGVTRVRHNLATKPPTPRVKFQMNTKNIKSQNMG